ncbi:zinc-binding metallopeptidase family protein [Rubidibacter lacunae]|uniref:hypothetical protein n=1 Tax=Rubidibacter lacunae TaxID=582514 RepID=UPI0004136FB1|nr:hypothetical protein [Rubidibacter lacunae]
MLAALPTLSRAIRRTGLPCKWLMVPAGGELVPDTRCSDRAPFWDAGYPAAMVTDTSFLRNLHYHRPSDTLDLDFLTAVCSGLIAGLSQL